MEQVLSLLDRWKIKCYDKVFHKFRTLAAKKDENQRIVVLGGKGSFYQVSVDIQMIYGYILMGSGGLLSDPGVILGEQGVLLEGMGVL